jgi:Zn-finger nucleic acid-binding protein
MEQDAQATLAKGLQLDKGDLDKLITEFEQLVCHAGYDINQDLVLRIFTSALPNAMYEYILRTLPQPASYEQWRSVAIDQQRVYVHMRNRTDHFKTKKPPTTNTWKPFNSQWRNPQQDPNAMDTSPGRTRARVAEAEDFLPGGNRYEQ